MYVTTRTLCALSNEGLAHKKLGNVITFQTCTYIKTKYIAYVNKQGVPIYALICTSAVSLVCFLTSWIPGEALFSVLSSLAGIAGLVN